MAKILGVDDSATMRRILEMTFAGDPSSQVATVMEGENAIRAATDHGVDIVLADGSLSAPDGYDIAARLRSNPATANIAVIVLASQHHPYDAERGKQSGVDDHILKPFETQALIDKVRDVLARPRAASSRSVAAAPPLPASTSGSVSQARPPAPAAPPRPPVPGVVQPSAPKPPAPGVGRSTIAFGSAAQAAAAGIRPATPAAPVVPASRPQAVASPAAGPAAAAPAPAAAKQPALELPDDDAFAGAPTPPPARPAPVASSSRAAAATAANGEMANKLSGMGLSPAQVDGVLALSREVIERVVWEVVPDLAETIIREEIRRLTNG